METITAVFYGVQFISSGIDEDKVFRANCSESVRLAETNTRIPLLQRHLGAIFLKSLLNRENRKASVTVPMVGVSMIVIDFNLLRLSIER